MTDEIDGPAFDAASKLIFKHLKRRCPFIRSEMESWIEDAATQQIDSKTQATFLKNGLGFAEFIFLRFELLLDRLEYDIKDITEKMKVEQMH